MSSSSPPTESPQHPQEKSVPQTPSFAAVAEEYQKHLDIPELLSRIPAMYFVWQINHETTETSFLYVSDHIQELYGVSPAEAIADPTLVINMIVEEDVEPFSAAVLQSIQDLSIIDRQARMRRPDGQIINIHYKARPRRESRDGVDYTVWDGVIMDVTDHMVGRDYHKQQIESLMKDALQPMFSVDIRGTITDWNPLLEDTTGYLKSEVIDTPILDWIQPQDQAKFASFAAQQQQQYSNRKSAVESSPERDFQFKAKDGTTRYIRLRAKVTFNVNDEVSGLVVCCHDMTLMKEAQEQKDAALMLVHKERGLTEWLSHEVRNPLSVTMEALLTLKELTDHDNINNNNHHHHLNDSNHILPKIDASASECLQVMTESITYVVDLLNNMMDLDQCSQGQMPVSLAPCHVRDDILLPTFRMMKSLRPQHPVKLRLEAPPIDIVATVDKLRLRQVLTNLIANSFKFTTTGFVEVELKLPSDNSGASVTQSLQFYVRDSGCGVMPSNYDTLFSKWEQLGSSRNGTGIGLCLCQALVKAMGGSIRLNQTYDSGIPGHPGAEFIVDLPILTSGSYCRQESQHKARRSASSSLSSLIEANLKSPNTSKRINLDEATRTKTVSLPPLFAVEQATCTPTTATPSAGAALSASALSPTGTVTGPPSTTAAAPLFTLQPPVTMSTPTATATTMFPTTNDKKTPCHSRNASISRQVSLGVEPLAPSFVPRNIDVQPAPKNSYFAGKYYILIVDDEKMGRKFLKRRFSRLFPGATITEVASGEEALIEATRQNYDIITMDHFMAIDEMNGDDTIRLLRLAQNDALIVGVSGNDKQAEHFQAGADAFFQKPLPSDALLTATLQRYLAPPAEWNVLILSQDKAFADLITHRLRHVAAHHFTTLSEAEKRWNIISLSCGAEAMDRLTVESYDCVIFNGCNGVNGTSDVYFRKHLRNMANNGDIVVVDCRDNTIDNTSPEESPEVDEVADFEVGSGLVKWPSQSLPSVQEMRQSLCYALLSIRSNNGNSSTDGTTTAASAATTTSCTKSVPKRNNSGVMQLA